MCRAASAIPRWVYRPDMRQLSPLPVGQHVAEALRTRFELRVELSDIFVVNSRGSPAHYHHPHLRPVHFVASPVNMLWNARADVVYGSTEVHCNQDHGTLDNSMGQNPCLVYAYMVGSCASVFVEVDALNQSSTYPAPLSDSSQGIQSAGPCTCGRVPYNLISACASCQGKNILPWQAYNSSCGNFVGQYNFSTHVPVGTALPKWATKQTTANIFVWDTAVSDNGDGEFLPSNSSTTTTSSQPSQTPDPSSLPRHPYSQELELEATAGVALGALAVALAFFIISAFIYLWRRVPSKSDKAKAPSSSRASTILHSVLFTSVVVISLINSCTTTWTSVGLTVGGALGVDSLRHLLNYLVFTSWWTFVGSAFFLLAFLYDRSNRDQDGTFTAKRFGTLHGHLLWLLLTWCLWLLGASLFAASIAQMTECQLHCTQLRVISAFAFIELIAISMILVVVVLSYWSSYRRSRPPKRLSRPQSQSQHPARRKK